MKLWFLLAVMPGASDTLQRDTQGCDGVIACSLPGVQPLPQHHSGTGTLLAAGLHPNA